MRPPDIAEPPSRLELVALLRDYRARHASLVEQAEEVARLEARIQATADREAEAALLVAREEIRAALLKARGTLLSLSSQVQQIDALTTLAGRLGFDDLTAAADDWQLPSFDHARQPEPQPTLAFLPDPAVAPASAPPASPPAAAAAAVSGDRLALGYAPGGSPRAADAVPARSVRLAVVAAVTIGIVAASAAFVAYRTLRPAASEVSAPNGSPSAETVTTDTASSVVSPPTDTVPSTSEAESSADTVPSDVVPPAASPAPAARIQAPAGPQERLDPVTPPAGVAPAPRPSAAASPAVQAELVTAAERWLDAYHRGDRATMGAVQTAAMTIEDVRAARERLPASATGVRRALDEVNLQLSGPVALLTARLNERAADQSVDSYLSQIWIRRGDAWQLESVRLISAASLGQVRR